MLREQTEHMDAPDRCLLTRKNLSHREGRPPHHVTPPNARKGAPPLDFNRMRKICLHTHLEP